MTESQTGKKTFLLLAFVLATCSLVYELAFAKVISELTGNPTMWESLSMGSFLLGIGAQTVFFRPEKDQNLWERLIRNELLISSLAVVSWYLIHYLQMNYRAYLYDNGQLREFWGIPPVYILGILSQPLVFLIGWLSGFELTFFLNCRLSTPFRHRESVVLAVYHFGALAGTLVVIGTMRLAIAPLTLITTFAALNVLVAMYLIVKTGHRVRAVHGIATILFIGWSLAFSDFFEQIFLKNHYYNQLSWSSNEDGIQNVFFPEDPVVFARSSRDLPAVKRLRSPFQVIDFVMENKGELTAGELPEEAMFINGRFQISGRSSAEYHEHMAHISLGMMNRVPETVAVLGGGDAALVHEILKHKVGGIDLVEIDPVILDLASNYKTLTDLNHNALKDPRVTVIQRDAFRYMRKINKVYDAVYIDLTYPFDFDSAKFYSAEFLSLIYKHLSPDGILVAGVPMDMVYDSNPEISNLVKGTIKAAGFEHAVSFNHGSHHFLMVSRGKLRQSPEIEESVGLSRLNLSRWPLHAMKTLDLGGSLPKVFSIQFPDTLMVNDPFF